jgi:hypothetical protein
MLVGRKAFLFFLFIFSLSFNLLLISNSQADPPAPFVVKWNYKSMGGR